ncbi:uncharacterized protein LOC127009894 isoform X1 [Eriocheir sinensis]|uniref:uncharacterized protein LOC127009894 isoform X1 n=1 Tax=Eriocheir sinensis TaxID=95602 RepID=UPI0021C756E1|nr:uncharacterized protein LOC127009894 isoform X1 [Eriocheir sinensis]
MQLDILKTPSGFLKLLEIAFTIIIISVIGGVKDFTFIYVGEQRAIFYGGVMVMAMVVTPLLLVTYLLGHATEMHKMPFEMLFNAVLAVFMVSAGVVITDTSFKLNERDQDIDMSVFSKAADAGKTAGSFAVINGVIYGLDTFVAKQIMDRETE